MSDIPSLINVTVSITEHDDCSVSYAVSAEGGDLCHKSHATIESAARDIGASIYEAAVGIKRLPPGRYFVSPPSGSSLIMLPERGVLRFVNHKDGDPHNLEVSNLEIVDGQWLDVDDGGVTDIKRLNDERTAREDNP